MANIVNLNIHGVADEITASSNQTIEFEDAVFEYPIYVEQNTTLAFDTSRLSFLNEPGVVFAQMLAIRMGENVRSVTFPNYIRWSRGFTPTMNVANKTYYITLESRDGGQSYSGNYGGCE